jgi:LuxR family maltose regulon positive regulatory protein
VTSLLPTKLYLPPVPAGYVARPQLFGKLDEALARRLTLVSAPAGAGKTTLVSAWAQSLRKKGATFGWLSLDEADNAPAHFMEYVIACLEESGVQLNSAASAFDSDQPVMGEEFPAETIPASIIRGLMNLQQELVLILDDYHVIHNQEVHAALGYLLEHMPPRLHIILLTRSDPPLELARMRVAGQLEELRMEHLRFSEQETAAFLEKSAGVQLTEANLAALNARTEGWIAGLQMAAISLRECQDVSAFVAAFAGSNRFVYDYLLEQVLNQQTPEVCRFLLKTSVLERISAPLCEAVAETGGEARALLDTVERANLFLTPLDDERAWYRYHPLFADLLKLMLEQTHPGLSAELHIRACRWFEAQDTIPEALHHALAAGDVEMAARLVAANVLALVEQAELTPILLGMDAAPREQRESMPWLGVAHAWALAYTGQIERAGAALTLAEERLDTLPINEHDRIAGHIAAVRAYIAWVHGSQPAAVDYAEAAGHLLPPEEIAVRALNLTTLGNALKQYEASQRAVEVLEQAMTLARQAGQSHVFMSTATALSCAYFLLGKLHQAHAVCQEAVQAAEAFHQRHGQPLPAAASVYAELANILCEWGETEQAILAARKGLALSERWGQTDTILLCLQYLANGLSLAHDFEGALQVIQRAHKLAQRVSPWFVRNVDKSELRIRLDVGDIDGASRFTQDAMAALPTSLEACLLVKQNQLDKALSLLEGALPEAMQAPSLETVRLGVIQSLAFYLANNEPRALAVLKQTLELAEPENQVAAFVREGEPMKKLLRLARAQSFTPEFTRRLLVTFEAQPNRTPAHVIEPLIEPLSERELEILTLLNGPLSTPEIAEQLIVSANTVRTHIKNIYGKLGVHGRSGAVRRAMELGLLS